MPQHQETIVTDSLALEDVRIICYQALEKLGWKTILAAENILVAKTPQTWKRYANDVTMEWEQGSLRVTSKMTHGELIDAFGRTKKDVADFTAAFQSVRELYQPGQETAVQEKIQELEAASIQKVETELQLAAETDRVMKIYSGNSHLTVVLIAINLLVFIAMVAGGVNFFEPSADDIIRWGGNLASLTTEGEWWRMLSCIFVHIGILHLIFNMYGLYIIGRYLEPMLGKPLFLSAYLFTGVGASLASLWWHRNEILVSAGASGAIFGMFGLFLALLLTDLIPKQVRSTMLQSTAVFVGYNLIYGIKGGVDNSAHIGGLVAGFLSGLIVYQFLLKKEEEKQRSVKPMMTVLFLLLTAVLIWVGINSFSTGGGYNSQSGVDRYQKAATEYTRLEAEALKVYENSNTLSRAEYMRQLREIVIPNWKKGEELFSDLEDAGLNESMHEFREAMMDYSRLQQRKAETTIQLFETTTPAVNETMTRDLNLTEEKIDSLIIRLQKMAEEIQKDNQ